MKVLFIDTAHHFLIDHLRKDGYDCVEDYKASREEILRDIHLYQGVVIRSRITIDKEFLDKAISLKWIARAGAGMESIDVNYAKEKNVICLNSPEGNRDAVGEHALGMLLMLFNNLNRADEEIRKGQWNRESNRGHEVQGKTIGIIGYGNMGKAFAKRLKGFDCNVIAYDKYLIDFSDEYVRQVDEDTIYNESDIVSLHIPLTKETEYLIRRETLNRFAKPIYLINTARGKCVKISDLNAALESGKVKGACLDVFEYEDSSFEKFSIENAKLSENPDWNSLINSNKVVLSPHIGGWTFESYRKISEVLYEKIVNSK